MDTTVVVLVLAGAVCVATWVASVITRDYSWVDRAWSIVPVAYVAIPWAATGFGDARLALMTLVAAAWGARLTYNFARKGGYRGVEDYRWPVLRSRMTAGQFQVFNVLFIVLFQNALLLLIALPAHVALAAVGTPLAPLEWALAIAFLALLFGEWLADEQQWRFQRAKSATLAAGRVPDQRCLTTGLWRYSRHPNFFFEQAQWWVFALWGSASVGTLANVGMIGPVLLTALFLGSTVFTESLSRAKYPEYAEYQRSTSMLIPWIPRQSRGAALRDRWSDGGGVRR